MLTTTGRELKFVQIVAAKSQPAPYYVRGFEGGLITCTCDGYKHRSKCRHQAIGLAQEQREQEAWQAFQRHEPALDDPTFDEARALVDSGPEPFDAPGVNWDGARDTEAVKAAYDAAHPYIPLGADYAPGSPYQQDEAAYLERQRELVDAGRKAMAELFGEEAA
jgi:hypothetical protein